MIERIFNIIDNVLMITATLATIAAPIFIMYAYWMLCSSH
jgi:hypothetical protein